jgi:error-prone DNA polymerase
MLLNVHSYYSLRYGTISPEKLVKQLKTLGYEAAVLTDINNSSGVFKFIKESQDNRFSGLAGMEFREDDKLLFIGIAKNNLGFQELNEEITAHNLDGKSINAENFENSFVIYPYGTKKAADLKDYEYIGVRPHELNNLWKFGGDAVRRCVMLSPVTFENEEGYKLHRQLRAIDNNILLSQLQPQQVADPREVILHRDDLLRQYQAFPQIIKNTSKLLEQCSFQFDFNAHKNKKTYSASVYDDKLLLEKLAKEGCKARYGDRQDAEKRLKKELAIVEQQSFAANFLITWDIIRYSQSRGFYHVGRGSGANSIIAYCLGITDVCPLELDLYFERFLNPKRSVPPDFDIDYSWKDRDDVLDYILKKYGRKHTALLGAMSDFKDRSFVRELGKIYGLPKLEIDLLVNEPSAIANKHEIARLILGVSGKLKDDFPNLRTIHAGGVLISELPIAAYTALDLPPKGFPTAQIDMYAAEEIGLEKFDILSQRGIGHINEAAQIIKKNRGEVIDVHDVEKFMKDEQVMKQLKSADTIGCFYIESPAMRGLLKKLKCSKYLTLVAASSIIRPGVAKSGMMRQYIHRFHHPDQFKYLHSVMEQQLRETFGVMVYQEDVLKVCHHFAGLDLADADLLRRLMSGKARKKNILDGIINKFFTNCKEKGYPEEITKEVWRQVESFAGYSFSKAHSASYAVESYQSLYLKSHYPLEFMTAVINNFGGFYRTRVYVNEAKKAGANINVPCVNQSDYTTTIYGKDIYLGFVHVQNLEQKYAELIPAERYANGPYEDLEDIVSRTQVTLEQLIILIRIGALRFTAKNKKELLWNAHLLLGKKHNVISREGMNLFQLKAKKYKLPEFTTEELEDAYDEIELLGFPVTLSPFDMLRNDFRGDVFADDLAQHVGESVRMVGHFVAIKNVPTSRGGIMNFGTFVDAHNKFFDTTHFPPSLAQWPFKGEGTYLVQGKVVEEFGFPSLEVERMAKMAIKGDPRAN